MTYIKVQKNKAYFKRYQVQFRRRREGKTDYYARRRMVSQDKTKYNTPKYRFVVRHTNKDVVCQIVSSTIKGDLVHAAAYAHELPRYGVHLGWTNYASTYCVGLLCGRRMLQKLGLDSKFEGQKEASGNYFLQEEPVEGRRPFKAFLDVGLKRTSTGARMFAALKGAVDAGLHIPYSETRFVGYNATSKSLDKDVLRKYLLGGHVAEYMESLEEDDEEAYNRHFSRYVEKGISGGDLEEIYKKAHAAIRADPSPAPKKAASDAKPKSYATPKRTIKERKDRVRQILAKRAAAVSSSGAADDDDDE